MSLLDTVFENTINRSNVRDDRRDARIRETQLREQDRRFYRSDLEEQRRYDSTYLQRLRVDAKRAGISPLAALGAQTVGPATSFQASSYPDYHQTPQVDVNSDTSAERVNEAHAKLLDKQADLVDEQIKDAIAARAGQASTPEKVVEALTGHEIKKPAHTPYYTLPFGVKMKRHPSSDMETLTNTLGEPAEWAFFLPQLLADWWHTISTHERTSRDPEKTGEKNLWRYRFLK